VSNGRLYVAIGRLHVSNGVSRASDWPPVRVERSPARRERPPVRVEWSPARRERPPVLVARRFQGSESASRGSENELGEERSYEA
jgi:hypothetical protein